MPESTGSELISSERRIALLSHIPCFAALPASLIAQLASALREERFSAGAVIVREGEVGDRLFLVESGVAHATTKGLGAPVILATLATGEMFGEIALLTDTHKRHATVTAAEAVCTLTLSAVDFDKALLEYPELRVDFVMSAEAMLNAKFLKRRGGIS